MRVRAVEFLIAAVVGIGAAAHAAETQAPGGVRRVGVLMPNDPARARHLEALRQGLRERGWIEGRNLQLVHGSSEVSYERVPALVAEFVRLPVDVIFVPSVVGAQAAKDATVAIPIVFSMGPDPVRAGLVQSFARPGGNLTGMAGFLADITGKQLELLREAVPHVKRVALLVNPANPNAVTVVQQAEREAHSLGLELHVVRARDAAELNLAFAQMSRAGVDALVVAPDGALRHEEARIEHFAIANRLPLITDPWRIDKGSLLQYGPSQRAAMRRVAYFIDRILRGAKPADLPVERPTQFELTVNLKTAKAIGVVIPETLLRIADEVIE